MKTSVAFSLVVFLTACGCGRVVAGTANLSDVESDSVNRAANVSSPEVARNFEMQTAMGPIGDGDFSNGPVHADLKVLTRVHGVAPETVYFSAMDSRSLFAEDYLGGQDEEAIAVSKLTYHFNFDDEDSGEFRTTGNSRNEQIGHASRAIHTFDCIGDSDDNWDENIRACVYNVGVRVQDETGAYADAKVSVTIESQDEFYDAEDTYCVSATSNWEGCPDRAVHVNDSLLPGSYSGKRVLYQRGSTASYGNIAISHAERDVTIGTYGEGSRPLVRYAYIGHELVKDSTAANFDMLEKDEAGNVIKGWAYNITITGLRLGTLRGGQAVTLMTAHDLDMDWSTTPNSENFGQAYFANNSNWCKKTSKLDCANVQYPYGSFITDSVIKGYPGSLPLINIGCFHSCMPINSGMAGNEVKTADEHNSRIMGSWGMVVSNNWFRGDHVGGPGAKHKLTMRVPGFADNATDLSLTIDPENFAVGGHIRGQEHTDEYAPAYAMVVDNIFNDDEQDPTSVSATFLVIDKYYRYSGVYGNKFIADQATASSGKFVVMGLNGRHIYSINNEVPLVYTACSNSTTYVEGYHDTATIMAIAPSWSGVEPPRGSQCAQVENSIALPASPVVTSDNSNS